MALRLSLTLAMLVAGTALLVASSSAGSTAETPKGGTLRLSSVFDVDSVDPALAYSINSWQLQYATCAKLFNYPDAPGARGTRVVPEVVDRYAISKDGRTYTFDLKRSFRFHTGARVTAHSFADALNRDAQPQLASPAAAYLREIVGAQAVIDGSAQTISGVGVLDPYRLQIRLRKPLGDLTARLTMPFFCPILPRTPVDPKGVDNPAGSGPYYVAERIVNQRVVLRRNPHYHGGRPANVDEIVVSFGETSDACVTAVEQDRNDSCLIVLPSAIRGVAERHGITGRTGSSSSHPE
jgi:ABC-type oligopeptide transport system substrate-binding subunit